MGTLVEATTTTGDTAWTYGCENGYTDVADFLLQAGSWLLRVVARGPIHVVIFNMLLSVLSVMPKDSQSLSCPSWAEWEPSGPGSTDPTGRPGSL